MRVLVVEDEPHMAELIRKGLSREGFAVDVAADGEECMGMATATTYDAIVLDIMPPASAVSRPAAACAATRCGRPC